MERRSVVYGFFISFRAKTLRLYPILEVQPLCSAHEVFQEALKTTPEGEWKEAAKIHFGLARTYAALSMYQQAYEHAQKLAILY